jgi:hypothetical protein
MNADKNNASSCFQSAFICVHRWPINFENSGGSWHFEEMDTVERRYSDALTEQVLGAIFEVSNSLGAGFLEKVYQRALIQELRLRGMQAASETSSWKMNWSSR